MQEWESDPLFAAAEVVQYSADRMESIFRLLLHEQSLVQGDHPDTKLLSSIEYHRRDLATTLEAAKWQLEDFEREVNAKISHVKQNVIARHTQFIGAIRQQINRVEQSMDTSAGNSLRNMNLNEQDRDGFALFLSGGESEDDNTFRRFLDPGTSSSSNENINVQKIPAQIGLEHPSSVQKGNYEEGSLDLEANVAKDESYLQKSKLRSYWRGMSILGSLRNLSYIYGSGTSRSFTKRLKDGDELRKSSSPYAPPDMQRCFDRLRLRSTYGCHNLYILCSHLSAQIGLSSSWISDCRENFRRSLPHIQARQHPLLFTLVVLLTLFILGIVVF